MIKKRKRYIHPSIEIEYEELVFRILNGSQLHETDGSGDVELDDEESPSESGAGSRHAKGNIFFDDYLNTDFSGFE